MTCGIAAAGVAAAQPAADTVDLIVHTSVVVDRPAAAVWPVLIDQAAWKRSIGSLQRVGGEPGAEGELRFMTPANGPPQNGFLLQTARVVPARQLVLKLFPRDRAAFLGFADFTLSESDGKTRMECRLYAEYRTTGMTPEQRNAFAKQLHEGTKTKLEEDNLELKRLVEQLPSAAR